MAIEEAALIGLGVIGSPLAHKLQNAYKEKFHLIASGARRQKLSERNMVINGDEFRPSIVSCADELKHELDLLIICVKNYHLQSSLEDICKVVTDRTIILPLQNGIYSYEFFSREFPNNFILQGYTQGPNTEIHGDQISYQNPGLLHIGSETEPEIALKIYDYLYEAEVQVEFEEHIRHMVWKKWMLNVAGNSVTALTGADYSLFKSYPILPNMCVKIMREFLYIAQAEGVDLDEEDIRDVTEYYISYVGSKQTSMLVDVVNERRTENEYLAGTAVELADRHNIEAPMIRTLYYLVKAKEEVYMDRKRLVE